MTPVERWACDYIASRDIDFAALPDAEKSRQNFFLSGSLDSIALMNMLLDAEAEFGFSFTPEAFQDRRIQTISGLGQVIHEMRNAS